MKTPFQFPTFEEWLQNPELCFHTGELVWLSEGKIRSKIYERHRKFYALEYLLALRDWVNEGWKAYRKPYYGWGIYYYPTNNTFQISPAGFGFLFAFEIRTKAKEFLSHKSNHTDTIEQLNILYSITQ